MNTAVARGLIVALAIGAVGGAVFYFLSLPLAWMLGSMIAVMRAGGESYEAWRCGITRHYCNYNLKKKEPT